MISDVARHLPIVSQKAPPEGDEPPEDRPPWHWSAICVLFNFVLWVPLSLLAQPLATVSARALSPAGDVKITSIVTVAAHVAITLGVGSTASGALVGRFGGQAGPREAALGGLAAAALACLLTATQVGAPSAAVFFVPFGAVTATFCWLGAKLGFRRRPR